MAKYTEKLTEKIVALLEADTYSISEICGILKISRKSFYEWKDTRPEFREAIERAVDCRDSKLLITARQSLRKKLEGYTLTETRTTYVPDKSDPQKMVLKTQVIKQKEYAPDANAIRLTLERYDSKVSANEKGTVLSIVVSNPKAAENLNLLCESLKNGEPKGKQGDKQGDLKTENESLLLSSTDMPVAFADNKQAASLRQEEVQQIITKGSTTDGLPPGYLYRK